jgi:acetyl-CoA carboxylase alpha subunit
MIPTWAERCEKFDDGEIVTNAKIQQMMQEEIDELRERLEETRQLYIKELALQKLSDISQAIQRELTNDEIMEICDEVGRDITRWGYFQIEFARAILAKACNLK